MLASRKRKGTQAALQRYAELKKSPVAEYKVEERTLNSLGYTLLFLRPGQTRSLYLTQRPGVSGVGNVYDSWARHIWKAGQKELAIQNYEKSLKLDPKNQNAVDMLKKLKEMK